ncbi:MAG TPA: hypothetical protein VNW94_02000 [Streptosporangiaceae bacterium]|nr:hypothetical protein [Streptosporangiaceae bacterium]
MSMLPVPARNPVPIIGAGHSEVALRRAGTRCDGWLGATRFELGELATIVVPRSPPSSSSHRWLPGDGAFDLVGVLRVLKSIGALGRVGPEVISPDLASLDCTDAARLVSRACDRVMGEALGR